ncbi:MAG: hypothetical protein H6811_05385 [Phycisphaeraceae bacterium]|nr:hypothetical protein [Phycisphaeraceae bacterium]
MPSYRYQVRNNSGQVQAGVMCPPSGHDSVGDPAEPGRARAVDLGDRGARAAAAGDAQAARQPQAGARSRCWRSRLPSGVMIRAGINLRGAAPRASPVERPTSRSKKVVLQLKQGRGERGKQFSEAIARRNKLFGPLCHNMVQAAEMSGSFSDAARTHSRGHISVKMETQDGGHRHGMRRTSCCPSSTR